MTSKVNVSAHCADTKYVLVSVTANGKVIEERILQNGESTEVLIYDDRAVTSREVEKPPAGFVESPVAQ